MEREPRKSPDRAAGPHYKRDTKLHDSEVALVHPTAASQHLEGPYGDRSPSLTVPES